jgi:hypothetical protein
LQSLTIALFSATIEVNLKTLMFCLSTVLTLHSTSSCLSIFLLYSLLHTLLFLLPNF